MQATSTRDLLVSAAREVLGEKGYDATTVRQIAAAAGVPQGLIHYYFGGKDLLLAALLLAEAQEYRQEQVTAASAARNARGAVRAALGRRRKRVADDPAWHRLRYELFALGLRRPEMKSHLAELLATGRHAIAEILDRSGAAPKADREALAAVVLAAVDGLALQSLADASFDLEAAYRALEQLLEEIA